MGENAFNLYNLGIAAIINHLVDGLPASICCWWAGYVCQI